MNTTLNRQVMGMVAAFALLLAACGSDAAATETTTTAAADVDHIDPLFER